MKLGDIFGALICLTLVFVMVYCAFGFHEVETFQIDATLTTKEMTDEYKSAPKLYFFWVDGDRAGQLKVGGVAYARYAEGDLIPIKVTIKEDWFGNIVENYSFGY